MNGWDWAVVGVFGLEIVVAATVFLMVLKIKNGPVARLIARCGSLSASGMSLAKTGRALAVTHRSRIVSFSNHVRDIKSDLRLEGSRTVFADEPINFARLTMLVAGIGSARNGMRTVSRFLRRGSRTPEAPSARKVVPSIAQRLGLVPPVARRLAPAIRIVKIAVNTHRQLRSRGIL